MANNPQYLGGPGLPIRPMMGSIPPPQNIPPPMPPQFRPVVPIHPSQHFTPPPQQYPSMGPTIPQMNVGMPPLQNHQMQFAQPIQPMTSPNVPLNRPMSSGLPQPVQDLQVQSSFPPPSGGPSSGPPVYDPNGYTTQYQQVPQMSLQSNSIPGQPNHGPALFTPMQQMEQPSSSLSTVKVADSPKPAAESSSDWLEHMKNGRRFYYNKKTRKSTWEKPLELLTPIEIADATTDWKEYTSLDGKKYFYNKVTKQSKWLIPDELKLARERAEKASCSNEVSGDAHILASAPFSVSRTPGDADNAGVTSTPVKMTPEAVPSTFQISSSPGLTNLPNEKPEMSTIAAEVNLSSDNSPVPGTANINATSAETAVQPMNSSNAPSAQEAADSSQNINEKDTEEVNQSSGVAVNINSSIRDDKPIERETPTYTTKQEAKEAFKALLASANVESDWTWEQTMRLIINDKRYGALKSLGERKQAFNEYLSHKKKQEAEGRRAKNKKAKEDFRKMLEECSELTSSTRWGKAVNMLGSDERFKAIDRGIDREDLFEEYLAELEAKERAKREEDYVRYILEYRKFLESCDFIKGNSQWRRVKDRLEIDERCSRLDTLDRLKYFQEYVGDLEKEEEEQRRLQKEEIRKIERKNRDEFRKLMDSHISDGVFTAKTIWREYHAKVKDLPAYQAVSSNSSGSTPKELFDDLSEELTKKYEELRTLIKDFVKSEKIPLTSTWTIENFKAVIADEISDSEASDDNLKLIFEEILEKVREKEEKEAKRRKRLGDEFFNILCSIKDITVDLQWKDALHLFQDRDEYKAIDDEAFSQQIYEEYLGELKEKEKERKRKEEKLLREKEKEREREREREKRSRERREKSRKRDRDRGKNWSKRDEEDADPDLSDVSGLNESRKSGKDKDRKRRKRHRDVDTSSSDKEERSRSSHRTSSEGKKSRHVDLPESDSDSKQKKHNRDQHNGGRKKVDSEELEDGELGIC